MALNPWTIQQSHTHTESTCKILMNFIEKCLYESAAGAHFSAKIFLPSSILVTLPLLSIIPFIESTNFCLLHPRIKMLSFKLDSS